MNWRTVGWAAAFVPAGVAVAAGWFPGASSAAQGPRVGLSVALLMMGILLAFGAFAGALRARSERAAASPKAGCPVGAKCACGHFNFKPRPTCRQCGAATAYTA